MSRLRLFWRKGPAEPGLTCREVVELVSAYLDDALEPAERARFEEHLAGCDACTEFVAQFRTTTTVLTRFTEQDLEPEVRDAMLQTFRAWRAGST
jgi:anti-sigma factor RsiW